MPASSSQVEKVWRRSWDGGDRLEKVAARAGDSMLVDAAEAVAAAWAGEDQEVGIVLQWKLAADGLEHQRGEG
jgi:hypothetical protein